ncbi:MAG: hypothetical protein R2712_18980 [Vicinamibacterales bacterium]
MPADPMASAPDLSSSPALRVSVGRFRLGGYAMAIDAACALAAMAVAYVVRFGVRDAWHFLQVGWPVLIGIVALQIASAAALGLYRPSSQAMWPLRLVPAP